MIDSCTRLIPADGLPDGVAVRYLGCNEFDLKGGNDAVGPWDRHPATEDLDDTSPVCIWHIREATTVFVHSEHVDRVSGAS